jgi:hypothetical protein
MKYNHWAGKYNGNKTGVFFYHYIYKWFNFYINKEVMMIFFPILNLHYESNSKRSAGWSVNPPVGHSRLRLSWGGSPLQYPCMNRAHVLYTYQWIAPQHIFLLIFALNIRIRFMKSTEYILIQWKFETRIYSYSYSVKIWNTNIFVFIFGKNYLPEYIHIRIR